VLRPARTHPEVDTPDMGGMLDCSHDAYDDEVDVTNHVGPINKPYHKMTIRELEYSVRYDKQEYARTMRRREGQADYQRPFGVYPNQTKNVGGTSVSKKLAYNGAGK